MSVSKDDLRHLIKDSVHEELERHSPSSQPAPQESHDAHVCGCPDCLCNTVDRLEKTSEVACENCKLPLGKADIARKVDHCPFCGHKKGIPYHWNFETNKPEYG